MGIPIARSIAATGAAIAARRAASARQRGSVMVIVAVCMPVFFGMMLLAVDLGTLFRAREQVQMAADAGALAGAEDVVNNTIATATATTDATNYAEANSPGGTPTVITGYNSDPDSVKVTVNQPVSLAFASLFGISTTSVGASAVATSDLSTPLAYFGSDESDLQDGSSTSDGWDNFCATDTYSWSTSSPASDDPARCPQSASPENDQLDGWTVAHGGIDISRSNFYSPPGSTTDQMVDLTGTCVEQVGSYPSPHSGHTTMTVNGSTTNDDGFCENNADGEIEEQINTIPGQTYTVTYFLGSNTWGYPYEKPMMVLASDVDLSTLPPIADTNGSPSDPNQAGNTTEPYGTVYPLENNSAWPSWNGDIIAHDEVFYEGPTGGDTDPDWQTPSPSFTFTANKYSTWIGFGSLNNCVADWTTSGLTNGYFYPASTVGLTPSDANAAAWQTTTWTQPPPQVNDDVQSPYQNQCKYGPGISDVNVSGPHSVSLTG